MTVGQELISKHKLPTGKVSLFVNLLISRFLLGNRSYLLFLRAFKHSVEAECSGRNFTKCNLWSMASRLLGDWHFCIVFIMQHQPFKQLPTVWSLRRVQIVGRTMTLWWLCLTCRCSEEAKPCTYTNMSKSALVACFALEEGKGGGRYLKEASLKHSFCI